MKTRFNGGMKLLTLLVAFSGITHTALAADGTVKFKGNILDTACTVDSGSADQTVTLGDIAKAAFKAKDDTAAPTKFSIKLTACPTGTVNVKFDGVSDPANLDLLKLDTGQTATGVAIQITDAQNNLIKLHESNSLSAVTVATDKTATMNFIARYQATSATVGSGTANATSQFTVIYN